MHVELCGVLAVVLDIQPFDPLVLNMMVDALCSYHFSDVGVGNHVSSVLVDRFP